MLYSQAVSLILCLVSISGKGWAKKCHQKLRMTSSSPVFARQSCPFHVTSLVEFYQRYGSILKIKEVGGMVLDVVNKNTNLNQNSCFILTEYDLGGYKRKRKELNICSVLKVPNHHQYLAVFFYQKPRFLYCTHWRQITARIIYL